MPVKKQFQKDVQELSTGDAFLQNLSPEGLRRYEQGYRDFLQSEMVISALQEDVADIQQLAKTAKVSSNVVRRIEPKKNNKVMLDEFLGMVDGMQWQFNLKMRNKRSQTLPTDLIFIVHSEHY